MLEIMPDPNICVHHFPDTTLLQASCNQNDSSTTKASSSEDDLYDASVNFLHQHLKRKNDYDLKSNNKRRIYSDTLLFEFRTNRKQRIKFLKLQNVEDFDKVLKLESSLPDRTLSKADLLPTVKKPRSNLSSLFVKGRNKESSKKFEAPSSNGGFFNILRKLSPKNSRDELNKTNLKSEEGSSSIELTSQSPTITSNSSFPSMVATIPSNLIVDTGKSDCLNNQDNTSRFIVTNVWPPKNFKSTLTDIEESPRKSSKSSLIANVGMHPGPPEVVSQTSDVSVCDLEEIELDLTYKNTQYSDSESELSDKCKVRKISSKLSVCSEQSEDTIKTDDDYTDCTDSEEIDNEMLSPLETASKLLDGDNVEISPKQIHAIVNNLVTQLRARNINCAYNNCNKEIVRRFLLFNI